MNNSVPNITAHTGCMGTPSNSLLSVRTGILSGADVIEDDIRITADGIVVLAHDDELTSSDGREYSIAQHSFRELNVIEFMTDSKIAPFSHIAALEDMLHLVKASNKQANLDVKDAESIQPIARIIKKMDMLDQIYLTGCKWDWAMRAQREAPELTKLLNVNEQLFREQEYRIALSQTCEEAIAAHCRGINISEAWCRPELIAAAESLGLGVYIFTVNNEVDMKKFLTWGFRSITTKNVQALMNLRSQRIG